MKIGERMAIFLGALLLTLAAFNLMATQAIDILNIGRQDGQEIIVTATAPPGSPIWPFHHFLSREPLENLLPILLVILAIALIVSGKNKSSGRRPSRRSYQTPNP